MARAARSASVLAVSLCLAGCMDSTKPIPIAYVAIDPTSASLVVGTDLQLTASVHDVDNNLMTDRAISWKSDNTALVRVTQSGLVTAVAPGQVTITATSEGHSATASITSQPRVANVLLTASRTTLSVGEQGQVSVRLEDANHAVLTGRNVTWSSSTNAATVSATGLVTAVALGTTTITAESEGRFGVIVITIAGPVASVAVTPELASTPIGGTVQLTASPRDASGTLITGRRSIWTSSSDAVARVNADGLVTAAGPGRATITATLDGKSGSATVTVPDAAILAITAVGTSHSCALDANSRAYCWGDNSGGQVGDGSFQQRSVLTAVATAVRFSTLSGGGSHSCGIATDGIAYCWGGGAYGQLGDGGSEPKAVPTPVSTSLTFTTITAGANHTCALVASGAAYCWGDNSAGQLGNASNVSRSTPVAVLGAYTFVSISAGAQHTCAVTAAGSAFCWGANDVGQLGDGTTSPRNLPNSVSGGPFASLSAGVTHTCGVTPAGAAYCWGGNTYGQLGIGTNSGRLTPTAVSGTRSFATVSTGALHTCGVTPAGGAFCWGSNATGQLGDGTTSTSFVPVAVTGGLTFGSISATSGKSVGDYYYYYDVLTAHTCGVTTDRVAYCWGDDSFGQLGSPGTGSPRPLKVTGQQ